MYWEFEIFHLSSDQSLVVNQDMFAYWQTGSVFSVNFDSKNSWAQTISTKWPTKSVKRKQNSCPFIKFFSVLAHCHPHDRLVAVGHCGHDGDSVTFVGETGPFCFAADKPCVCIFGHLAKKIAITRCADVKDSYCVCIWLQIKVKGHLVHDS